MEYSFRYSPHDELKTLRLDDYGFTIRTNGRDEVISYARIVTVRISRSSSHVFKVYLYPDDHNPIIIPSRSFSIDGKVEDQSRPYSLMVRVLHHHLKEKSQAEFISGINSSKMWQWAVFSAVFSFAISIAADFLGFSLINPYIQASILTGLTIIMIFALTARRLPKGYNPGEIPLQFLP